MLALRRPDPLSKTVEKVIVECFAITFSINSFQDCWCRPCPRCVCLARRELPRVARLLKLIPIRVTDPHELAMLNLEARELTPVCKRCSDFLKRAKSDGNGDPRPFFRSEEAVTTHVFDTGPKLSHQPFPTGLGRGPRGVADEKPSPLAQLGRTKGEKASPIGCLPFLDGRNHRR